MTIIYYQIVYKMLLWLVHYHVIVQLVFLTLVGIPNKFPIQKQCKKQWKLSIIQNAIHVIVLLTSKFKIMLNWLDLCTHFIPTP